MPLPDLLRPSEGVGIDLSRLVPADIKLPQGNTSKVEVVRDALNGKLFVRKTTTISTYTHLPQVASMEYEEVGFRGFVRVRSMQNQHVHMRKASALGLGVVNPVYSTVDTLLYPFTPGESLKEHLIRGETIGIHSTLTSINNAHRMGFRHGDRWAKNIIIGEDDKVTHVDFDIALGGRDAEEFELAQVIYDSSSLTTKFEDTVVIIGQFAQQNVYEYDWKRVARLLRGYERFYAENSIGRAWRDPYPRLGEKLKAVTSIFNL